MARTTTAGPLRACGAAAAIPLFGLVAACSFEARSLPPDTGGFDSPVAGLDGGMRDGPVTPDGRLGFDAPAIDAGIPDAPVPDSPVSTPDAPSIPDAAVPTPDAPAHCWPWTPTNIDPCNLPPSNGSFVETVPLTFDTDTGITTAQNGSTSLPKSVLVAQDGAVSLRVVVFDDWDIRVPVTVVGSHPLVIVALGNLTIEGGGGFDASATIDSKGLSQPGPGGNDPAACGDGSGATGQSATAGPAGGGGGGGGAFGASGGHGGAGSGTGSGGGGDLGAPSGEGLSPLRGGCPGGKGGAGVAPGSGGAGGGAIQLVAKNTLTLTGAVTLRASGAGGQGGAGRGGGGGGGSGGAIFLEAGAVVSTSQNDTRPILCANGGSGGEGGAAGQGQSANGVLGTCDTRTPARTINQSLVGGDGGDGGYLVVPSGVPGFSALPGTNDSGFGGGGGGGGVGRLRVRSALVDPQFNALVTPDLDPEP